MRISRSLSQSVSGALKGALHHCWTNTFELNPSKIFSSFHGQRESCLHSHLKNFFIIRFEQKIEINFKNLLR